MRYNPDIVEQAGSKLHLDCYGVCIEAARRSGERDYDIKARWMYASWLSGALPEMLKTFCQQTVGGN